MRAPMRWLDASRPSNLCMLGAGWVIHHFFQINNLSLLAETVAHHAKITFFINPP